MKKFILAIIIILFLIFVAVVFAPVEFESTTFNNDERCVNYCQEYKQSSKPSLDAFICSPPIGGCFESCMGISVGKKCSTKSVCWENCQEKCYGLITSNCSPSALEKKIKYLYGREN